MCIQNNRCVGSLKDKIDSATFIGTGDVDPAAPVEAGAATNWFGIQQMLQNKTSLCAYCRPWFCTIVCWPAPAACNTTSSLTDSPKPHHPTTDVNVHTTLYGPPNGTIRGQIKNGAPKN